jgi:hypothetical protein
MAQPESTRTTHLDNARSGQLDDAVNSSHDWRSRGIDHGGVLSDRRAERLGPVVAGRIEAVIMSQFLAPVPALVSAGRPSAY